MENKNLFNLYKNLQKDFDPKKDHINSNGYEKIKPGTYTVSVIHANHTASQKSGFEQLNFTMEVVDGRYAGQKEFVGVNLSDTKINGEPMPEFVINKNLKMLITLSTLLDVTLTDDLMSGNIADIYDKLERAFADKVGKIITMKITTSPNGKDPSNPYRNYEFSPKADSEDPFNDDKSTDDLQIDEADVPF